MKPLLPALLLGLGLSTATVTPAAAYQIDCAILLCLAGGFPPSEPCARARAEMIRRITPWPIEPPLQLWRCPMRAEFPMSVPDKGDVIDATLALTPTQTTRPVPSMPAQIWKAFGEDVTDYVMAIKVYDLSYYRHYSHTDDICSESGSLKVGTYDKDWNFHWRRVSHRASPAWLFNTRYQTCTNARFRGVGMEWRDYEGKIGKEVVRY